MNLENLSYIATIAGVIVNGAFLYFLIQQVKQGQDAQKAAKTSAEAAQAAVKEAIYTRIDQQAPRVFAILDMATLGGIQDGESISWNANQRAVMPRDSKKRLYVGTIGTLINEGVSTATVRLNGSAKWITDKEDEFDLIGGPIEISTDERTLRPGEQVKFLWSEFKLLEDWADAYTHSSPPNPRGACFMEVIVMDSFEEGIVDHIFMEMSGRPLVPIEGDDGGWTVPDKAEFVAISYPTKRAHLRNENHKISPSWLEVYNN